MFSLDEKFNPRDMLYMPMVKIFIRLDLEQKILFLDRH